MSTNCLVTKLKESVNNDSLEKLGVISIKCANTNNNVYTPFLRLGSNSALSPITATISNGEFYDSGGNAQGNNIDIGVTAAVRNIKTSQDAIVEIKNKYHLGYFGLEKYTQSGANYIATYKQDSGVAEDFVFDIEQLQYTSLIHLIGVFDMRGDIVKALKSCSSIEKLQIYCGALTGDIKDIVAVLIENSGNTYGNIPVFGLRKLTSPLFAESENKITFNGRPFKTPRDENQLIWESASKIYVSQNAAGYTNIYCSGYTSSEIIANRAGTGSLDWQGKIVVDQDTGNIYNN